MRLFRRKKVEPTQPAPGHPLQVWLGLATRALGTKVARVLARYDQKLSVRQRKIVVTVGCLLAVMFSMNKLYQGLYGKDNPAMYLRYPGISRPVSPQLPDSIHPGRRMLLSPDAGAGATSPDSITQKK